MAARTASSLALALLLAACGGGGGGGGGTGDGAGQGAAVGGSEGGDDGGAGSGGVPPATDVTTLPHGLERRASLPAFDIPLEAGTDGGYSLVPVYPELPRFSEALHAAPVPGEARMAVIERFGTVKVFDDDPAVAEVAVVLDHTARVDTSTSSEQGLLGFAFDPDFERNRYVYLLYTRADPMRSVITRLVWDAASDRLDASGERTLLEIAQPFKGHNGGALHFGEDGYLYASLGDGGDGGDPRNHAQDLSSLLGKVLRIDVHPDDPGAPYAVPDDNPFVATDGARPEIYAYGFRNPYRFSFDRQGGALWLGDVGQNEIEEINVVESGANHGWRVYEGSRPYNAQDNTLPESAFTPPVFEYTHDEGLAVIGGYVYRGRAVPSLFGRYLFADFVSGTVWALREAGEGFASEALATIEGPTGFAESRDGEVMVISRYDGLFRLEPAARGPEVPTKLSATGLFDDVGSLTPVEGLIEYRTSHPFWSDGVGKRRWLGIPDGSRIGFSADDWTFPVGSVSVKHFYHERNENDPSSRRRLETRVLVHGRDGWRGYSYHWDEDQQDATLANERRSERLVVALASGETREQLYEYPSRADCMACHTRAEGFLLGPKTEQMNTGFDYPAGNANQLATFAHIGLFDTDIGAAGDYGRFPPIDEVQSSVTARARAYLDVNCSSCHQPGGTAPTDLDLRAATPAEAMNAVDVVPSAGDLGVPDARIIASGDREASVLWQRLRRTDEERMPPLSTHVIDEAGVRLIGEWIDGGP